MGDSSQTTTTQSQTRPWEQAMPAVNGLLGQLQGLIPNTGTTAAENGAINQLTQMGQAGNPYATGTQSAINGMLQGGGAMNYAPTVQNAYSTYQGQMMPLASNTNYDPYSTPGFSDALKTSDQDISDRINGMFAAGGRDMSGMNVQNLARGLAQGNSQAIASQYNQNVSNQQGAATNLFGAGNTTGTTLANMNQTGVNNQNTGINNVSTALTNSTWGPQATITAQELAKSIPASNLGLLTQIGVPLASLGTNSNGTSTTESQMSPFQMIMGGLGALGSGGSTSVAANGTVTKGAGSGILGLLGML